MTTRFPYFKFWVGKWLSSKERKLMDLEAQGAYMNLLSHYWAGNCKGLPSDSVKLGKLAEIRGNDDHINAVLLQIIEPCFKQKKGLLHNKVSKAEYRDAVKLSNSASNNGKRGAKKRWGGHTSAIDSPMAKNSYSESESESDTEKKNLKKDSSSGEPPGLEGAVRAFHFCKMPGKPAKKNALHDLWRQGVDFARMIASATDPGRRDWDFFDHVNALRPKHGGASGNGSQAAGGRSNQAGGGGAGGIGAKDYRLTDEEFARHIADSQSRNAGGA